MKSGILQLTVLIFILSVKSQGQVSFAVHYPDSYLPLSSIQKVDSVANDPGISSYFAVIYSRSMKNVESEFKKMDSATQQFVRKFEFRFADYFLQACMEEKQGNLSPSSPWKTYFSVPDAKQWQLILIGVNAHINADFMNVLLGGFSEQEIRAYKKMLVDLNTIIAKEYDDLFKSILDHSSYLRFINTISFGFGKKFGEKTLYKWRKRQIKLALLFYDHPKKFERRTKMVHKKKMNIDRMVLRH